MSKDELPSKVIIDLDGSKIPTKILEIMKKGQGKQVCRRLLNEQKPVSFRD